ncbi:helix-turn-helix domain-containing protein [Parashewanella tropica]|uniref:helix-turn-helix domain-containing protein n=1 Tax=Parashewanella tropica TaxID=2547970 RepID=UPI00105989BB|nr:helix-turn-helix domain-containing protein [Parashewanella tropica]
MNEIAFTKLGQNIWIKGHIIIFYGTSLDVEMHKHHAIQIVWSTKDSQCKLSNIKLAGSFIIDSQVEHQLQLNNGLLLLVEPQSILGAALKQILNNSAAISINDKVVSCPAPHEHITNLITTLAPLFDILNLPFNLSVENSNIKDKRILSLIQRLNLCFSGRCQKPADLRAADIASELSLSMSRFLHLFKNEVGIAWRPYLKWRRLICAITAMAKGARATEAAYYAGFSDSAHLSRTFRSMFGLSIKQLKATISES